MKQSLLAILLMATVPVAVAAASSPAPTSAADIDAMLAKPKTTAKASPKAETKSVKENADAKNVSATATTKPKAPVSEATLQLPAMDEGSRHLALGFGYPDLRLRAGLGHGIFADLKAAMDSGVSVYSARLGWNFWELGSLKALASAEAGLASISNVDTVTANGPIAGAALGLEYAFAKRFRIGVEAGPMWASASNSQASFAATDLVVNTALYYYLF